jgi:hypothetical protein
LYAWRAPQSIGSGYVGPMISTPVQRAAMVTGAAGGIGLATAGLLRDGDSVLLADLDQGAGLRVDGGRLVRL